ncbi:MAG: Rid family detoxifying hydrolase [Solirubrobacteraceae bacterium MAG38_C4-C5]|nr:Rid family detoxifying hydrolase [Candidatus Siliceabacter maunaloa]
MSHHREAVTAPGAPDAVGPYVHAVRAGGLLFCSGQVPLDPDTGELVAGPIGEQAARCLRNLQAVCEAAGVGLADAVRITVYLTDMGDFAAVNEVYAGFFTAASSGTGGDDPPARVAIGVAALPLGASVEMDAVVALPEGA